MPRAVFYPDAGLTGEGGVGAWGAVIMGFFGAVFAAMTMIWQWHMRGGVLAAPFLVFTALALAAAYVMRQPGSGIVPGEKAQRAIMWSSAAEGIGVFVAGNVVANLNRPEWLLPAIALVVGLHFLPIAYAAAFPPFYALGAALLLAAAAGFTLAPPTGGAVAGCMAALCLWTAAALALRRDWRARTGTLLAL